MPKIDKPVHGTDKPKAVGTGLDNHKMCLENDKPLLTLSMSDQHKPDGTMMIEGKEYINELFNPNNPIILSRLSVRRPPTN